MNNLIQFEEKLKKIQSLLKIDQLPMFPHVVLIGSQGAGKTSVLENLIGFRVFPRGATRCPVIVHLKNVEYGQVLFKIGNDVFSDPSDVQNALQQEMDGIKDLHLGATTKPLLLEVEGPKFVDLTFIDLPGIPQVAVGEQPSNAAIQLKKLSLRFLKTPHAVILVVLPATANLPSSDCLKFVRSVGNTDLRTIVVVNKLDLAEPTEAFLPILSGEKLPGIFKIVGVISKHSKEKRKQEDSFKRERKFLSAQYRKIAHLHGIKALQLAIANLLREHLKIHLADYWSAFSHAVTKTEKALHAIGSHREDSDRVIIEEVTRYSSVFCSFLSGRTWEIETVSLVGGARISYIFREIFNPMMDGHNPLSGLTRTEILTALRNACGTRPEILFIPEACFEGLARRQVNLLTATCRECVDLVLDQMMQLSKDAASPNMVQRFPVLYESIFKFAASIIQRRYHSCCEFVGDLMQMELCYINTLDADFQKEVDAAKIKWLSDRGFLASSNVPKNKDCVDNSTFWFSGFLLRKEMGDPCPTAPPMSRNCGILRTSAQEDAQCEILERLLVFYFNIVRKSLKDGIPKAIMLRLVNYVNDHLYAGLLEELQNEKLHQPNLLTEPDSVILEREELMVFYKSLRDAENDINKMQELLRRAII